MLPTLFLKGRDAAKQFLQYIVYAIRPEAEAFVSFRDTTDDLSSDCIPFATLSNVEMSYTRSLKDDGNDEENERLYSGYGCTANANLASRAASCGLQDMPRRGA
jgi:hypothetical protein